MQQATAPFQYAMATKEGCECIAHVLQALKELNLNATILSVDGMSACDMMSRKAMLQGLSNVEGGRAALSSVSMFHGAPSQNLWEDDSGTVHTIDQGEGGEQGDALMPLLHSLGQHGALKLHSEELRDEEMLLAFLDDTVSGQDDNSLRSVAGGNVQHINPGKTKVWNAAGVKPSDVACCSALPRLTHSSGVEWIWPTHRQGLNVLGTPRFRQNKFGDEKHCH